MLIDAHFHFDSELTPDESVRYYRSFMKKYAIDKAIVLSYCQEGEVDLPTSNFKTAWLKKAMSPDIFGYMALLHDFEKPLSKEDYLKQLEDGIEMGFDGWKSIDGKPNSRKRLGMSLADSRFDLAYEKAEKLGFPIVYHVGDPEYYWHDPTAYWFYDSSYPTSKQLYGEIDELLLEFPLLRITFAHFYFLSEHIDRAAAFLDAHPNVNFDITPGREMFHGFNEAPDAWRDFFKTYKNRIIWGSDVTNSLKNDGYSNDVYKLLTKVLPEGEPFYAIDATFTPLGLDADIIEHIRYKNQLAITGDTPKEVNGKAVLRCIEEFRQKNIPLSAKDKKELDIIAKSFTI